MKRRSLPPRLHAILELLTPCPVLADVGTDHGLIPTVAISRGLVERAVASDLREAPLLMARQTVEDAGLEDLVELRKGDGLKPLRGMEVDAVVLSGMSGELMVRILDEEPGVLSLAGQLIVQPNKDAQMVRHWARSHGWHVHGERMVEQRERFYAVIALVHGDGEDPAYRSDRFSVEALEVLGPLLVAHGDETARRHYAEQADRLSQYVARGGVGLAEQLAWFERAAGPADTLG